MIPTGNIKIWDTWEHQNDKYDEILWLTKGYLQSSFEEGKSQDNANSKFRKKDDINSQTHCFIHVIDAPSADNDDEIIIFKKFLDQIKKELGIFIIISLFNFFRNTIICSFDKTWYG